MDNQINDRVEQLLDYIMKNCLWQFHSRSWDRELQNAGILTRTTQLLCGEPASHDTPLEKCYWVDAVCLADAFRSEYTWLSTLTIAEIKVIMQGLRERMDYLTIKGSLNLELTDHHY